MRQATLGKSQYHAAILKFEKRMSNGWGGRINYTYSRLEDNQFGETQLLLARHSTGSMQDAYDLDAEYAIGLLDVPHKLAFSPIVELPFGEGKRWVQSGVGAAILGDWTISSIISIESGFPIRRSPTPTTRSSSRACSASNCRHRRGEPTARATSASRRRRCSGCVTASAAPASG